MIHDRHDDASASGAATPTSALGDDLLGQLDNFAPDAYASSGVARAWGLLREHGWLARALDPDYALPAHKRAAPARAALKRQLGLLAEVGRGSLPLGRIYEGHVNALELISRFATPAQRAGWYADARAGHGFGVWNTEMRDGIHIRAHADGEGYVLTGAKSFCSGARDLARPIITGQLWRDGKAVGWQMLVLPMERVAEGNIDESFWSPLGMQASASFKVDFTGVRVTEADFLGAPDDYHRQPHFSGGAIRFAAVQLGGAQALYDHTVALLAGMNRTHDPYQCHRIARMAIALETGRQWLDAASVRALPGFAPDREVINYANMTRTAVLEVCNTVLELCEQSVGARGFLEPKPIQRVYTDLKMYLRQPNPDGALAAVGHHAVATAQSPAYLAPVPTAA